MVKTQTVVLSEEQKQQLKSVKKSTYECNIHHPKTTEVVKDGKLLATI